MKNITYQIELQSKVIANYSEALNHFANIGDERMTRKYRAKIEQEQEELNKMIDDLKTEETVSSIYSIGELIETLRYEEV